MKKMKRRAVRKPAYIKPPQYVVDNLLSVCKRVESTIAEIRKALR